MRAIDAATGGIAGQLEPIMREAGAIALGTFGTSLKSWSKIGGSPVSEADIAVDRFLREELMRLSPQAGWLSEESDDDPARLDAREIWIADPIDGTRAYLAGRADWSVSVALVRAGRPVIAAVLAPMERKMYLAQAGCGARLNGAPISVSAGEVLDGARIAGPKPFLERLVALGIAPQPKVHSLALRLARVAAGELEAAFATRNSHDWDLAAADLLVHEAGGALTTFTGHALTYNRAQPVHEPLVAAGRARHGALVELARAYELA